MPDHEVALEVLSRTGPLAVSSANRTGLPAATNADDAEAMLGELVRVVLDAGATPGPTPSTIIDCTGDQPRMLRQGVVPVTRLDGLLGDFGTQTLVEE
jgi:tRNA A37 threonylcarbamoyladenosine synthetase subunit TsaC/SUA5/YrdC